MPGNRQHVEIDFSADLALAPAVHAGCNAMPILCGDGALMIDGRRETGKMLGVFARCLGPSYARIP